MRPANPVLFLLLFLACAGSALAAPPRALLVAQNEGTEITDLLVPFAVLSAAGVEVRLVAPRSGRVELWPDLALRVETTLADAGDADLVIVPAVRDPQDASLAAWVRERHRAGAMIASICDGVRVLAESGLLDGRAATGHFFSHAARVRDYPAVRWQRNRRWIEDERVLTSAGVSASAPASVRLVERLVGPEHADAVAARFGISVDTTHQSDDFAIGASDVVTALSNFARGLRRRPYVVPVTDGVDEFALAFAVDMLLRTSRASIVLEAPSAHVRTAHGLELIVDSRGTRSRNARVLGLPHGGRAGGGAAAQRRADVSIASPADAIPVLRAHLSEAFGARTEAFVATQLEMP